jgi:acetate kinase
MSSILTINGGSSSIKFAAYRAEGPLDRWLHGKLDRVGSPGTKLAFRDARESREGSVAVDASDPDAAAGFLIDWLEKQVSFDQLTAVGHRVVHGMRHTEPARVTPELLKELRGITAYDPDHLPAEIRLIEALHARHPELLQVACFDTAFHATMPRVARLLPIPRRFDAMGIRRYGFHGLSYTYLTQELDRIAGRQAAHGRVILAHLGNGASLAAVRDGRGIDTSMGFTPAGGIPMGTRPGDLDPGVAWYLMASQNLTPSAFNHLINHECGLLGVSETSSDMRDLLKRQASDVRAAEAVELFCYQTRKWIGALTAALGGLDTLVFSGGIGENTAELRARVCGPLQHLGIELSEPENEGNRPLISTSASRVAVRVIPTDEELMIARQVRRLLDTQGVA